MNYRIAFAFTAVLVILAILGTGLTGFADDLLTEENKKTIIEINTTEEWKNQRGVAFTNENIKYEENHVGIKEYGEKPFQVSDYGSFISYRTKVTNSSDITHLDKLEAEANLSDKHNAMFQVGILDCGSLVRPGDAQSMRIYCNSNYVIYGSGRLKGSGKTEIERDLSNISVDEGRIIIHVNLKVNTTEEIPKKEKSYIERIKLVGKTQSSRLNFLSFN